MLLGEHEHNPECFTFGCFANDQNISSDNCFELVIIGKEMNVISLISECEKFMINNININNLVKTIEYSVSTNNFEILYVCYLFILQYIYIYIIIFIIIIIIIRNEILTYTFDAICDRNEIYFSSSTNLFYINKKEISVNVFKDCRKYSMNNYMQYMKLIEEDKSVINKECFAPNTKLYMTHLIKDECIYI